MKTMKNIFIVIAAFFLFSLNNINNARAADIIVVVVDAKKVVSESNAAVSIHKQIQDNRDKYQDEITKKEEALRETDKKLSEQRSILSPEAFEEKKKEFKNKLIEVQRDVQNKRSLLDRAYAKAMDKVGEVTGHIIAEMAKEKGFAIAIPKSQALYSTPELDITDEVMKRLNEKLPNVKVIIKE